MHTIPYCYLLPVTEAVCHASAVPSLCLRFRFAPIDGASTDLQRIYNGGRTVLHRRVYQSIFCVFTSFSMRSKRIQYDVNEIRIV